MECKSFLFSFWVSFLFSFNLLAQTAGDIAFTGFNADGLDGFSFYFAADMPANTTIYFTDNDWDGASFPTNEGTVEWSHTDIVSAGTSIVIEDFVSGAAEATLGSANETDAGMNLGATNDALYAYVGSLGVPTTFLGAIGNNTNAGSDYDLTGTGLTEGTNAISISGDNDVMVMTGDISSFCPGSSCVENIYNASNWTLDNGTGDQSTDGAGSTDFPTSVTDPETGVALPVELISIYAHLEDDVVKLSWSTSSETNNDYFIIEKSIDGLDDFIPIGNVKGAGTKNSRTDYMYQDRYYSENSATYYRLKQVDFDEQYEYSLVVFLNTFNNFLETLEIFPNPFLESINIHTQMKGEIIVAIYDCGGKLIYSDTKFTDNGLIKVESLSLLKAGIYHLKLSSSLKVVSKIIAKK